MILNQHHITNVKALVDPARGVGHDERLDPQQFHHAHWQGHLCQTVAFVKVKAPLHRADRDTLDLANHQPPGMALHGADREIGNFRIGQYISLFDLIGEGT